MEPKAQHKFTNDLIKESSPYLLQHAHNPVEWHAWNDESLKLAKEENKPLLISIGYSSCHWCHVMEHESFENEEIAKLMNENFICIKIDREERPDIDKIYMDAVQILTGQGGWPLNCFAMPDGRPFYGGTYFRPEQWSNVLGQISSLWQSQPQELIRQAEKLTEGVQYSGFIQLNNEKTEINREEVIEFHQRWRKDFDNKEGGGKGAPKFPIPNNYISLLRYYVYSKDQSVLEHVELTLKKMAYGGIYDQVGGGFSRYSVDDHWKVPHFEKMLYDNAQMVSLYSEAYMLTKNDLYKQVINETLEFIEREMTHESGGFYSALDADSDGEEGKFYVWKEADFRKICGPYAQLMAEYYNVGGKGFWEHDNNILLRTVSDDDFAQDHNLSRTELENLKKMIRKKLLIQREKRVRPGLDDKILSSWNALMIKGYVDAYKATGNISYIEKAIRNANFIKKNLIVDDVLYHNYKNQKASIPGFLEDYALYIDALISLYQVTYEKEWLFLANKLTEYTISNFFDPNNVIFYFTPKSQKGLIARKTDFMDNVLPSANSVMANNLFSLGILFEEENYKKYAVQMLRNIKPYMERYSSAFSNWSILQMNMTRNFYVNAITGDEYKTKASELVKSYQPFSIVCATKDDVYLPYFENRIVDGETMIYICTEKGCLLPTHNVAKALEMME
ncbi:MAG: thioredoxin domain-containing protein [Bacteroidales bacterium]|nr:thioredoxin domain-containing protein [Bacteroidales bacterium]